MIYAEISCWLFELKKLGDCKPFVPAFFSLFKLLFLKYTSCSFGASASRNVNGKKVGKCKVNVRNVKGKKVGKCKVNVRKKWREDW